MLDRKYLIWCSVCLTNQALKGSTIEEKKYSRSLSLHSAKNLAMGECVPAILIGTPFPPPLHKTVNIVSSSEPTVNHVPAKRGSEQTIHPHIAPVRSFLGTGEAPYTRRGRDTRSGDPRLASPRDQMASPIRFGTARSHRLHVRALKVRDAFHLGVMGRGIEIGLAARHNPPGFLHDAAPLAQRAHRIRQVVQDLMGMDDVESIVGEIIQRVGVSDVEGGVVGDAALEGQAAGFFHDVAAHVDADDVAVGDQGGEVGGYGSRAAPDVADFHAGKDGWEEVGGGVGGCAERVRF